MPKYRVTVDCMHSRQFEVEADDQYEAQDQAVQEAEEDFPGYNWYEPVNVEEV